MVFVLWTLGFVLLGGRLVYLQLIRGEEYSQLAIAQRMRPQTIDPQRGNILDRNYKTLAMSIGADAVYALPDSIRDVEGTARQLAPYLSMSEANLVRLLQSKKTGSVWLARGLTPETTQAIKALGLSGIRIIKRPQRYYPQGPLAAHVLGIAGSDNQGLEGIEYYYESTLKGVPGQLSIERDASQRNIPGGESEFIPPQAGYDLILTIDSVIQYGAENHLREAVLSSKSDRGLILVMDPNSGEIFANAIFPTFDPNHYQEVTPDRRRNVTITDQYEPGSTFKFVTAAASLDLGLTNNSRTFNSGAYWEVGGGKVRNSDGRTNGNITFLEAVERSDNIVFAQLAVEMGAERFYPYIRGFGFGQRLGVDFPGEISGTVASPTRSGQLLQWANTGFGQGIAVTPLQLLTAVSAIANGGMIMQPHFVKEIRDSQGKLVQEVEPQILGRAVSEATAAKVSELLRSVVVNGNGNRADLPGYYVAGKTGTAEVPKGGSYGEERIASFIGFAPVDDPALAILVVLYNPKVASAYGGVLAAPVFNKVMEESLEYLGIKRRQVDQVRSPLVIVPNVSNFSKTEAQARLAQANLRWDFEREGSLVADQMPSPGARVPAQTTVHLFFYDPETQEEVLVPSVLGLSMRDASMKLAEAGLRIRIDGSGIAYSQSPRAGTKLPKGAAVEVNFRL